MESYPLEHDAIYLGAVGRPDVPDHESLWGLLIPIRREFDQYVNLRPIRLFAGIEPRVVLAPGETVDMVIVRENTEGEYSEIGGRVGGGQSTRSRFRTTSLPAGGRTDRPLRHGSGEDAVRASHVSDEPNGIIHTMPFWDEVVAEVAAEYADVSAAAGS
jgi:tartrate dehydrogenase/decarboxylase/D-malate dehydrogenase